RWNCVENYKTMLGLCRELEVPIVVSSDAHDPSWVGQFSLAEKLLEAVDFDPALVLNADKERLLAFLLE
ncbi:MAG: phosphatase, partial [Faecousia sp.]